MSRAHQYHQPNAPDILSDESGSDLDLDLQELDDNDSSHGLGVYSLHDESQIRAKRKDGIQIPLQKLRSGHLGGSRRRSLKAENVDETPIVEDDLRELLHENTHSEDSHGSFTVVEDDAPLLVSTSVPKSGDQASKNIRRNVFSRFGLTGFGRKESSHGKSDDNDEDEAQNGELSREIHIGQYPPPKFPPNAVSNAKYSAWSFLPATLYNEFSFFFNLYFLLVALSQIIPPLRIGYLSTYVAPLVFVLAITLGKEALDDIGRRKRDAEANKEKYSVLRLLQDPLQDLSNRTKSRWLRTMAKKAKGPLLPAKRSRLDVIEEEEEEVEGRDPCLRSHVEVSEVMVKARDLKVGDILKLGKDQRIPADLVILKSYGTESSLSMTKTQRLSIDPSNAHRSSVDPLEGYTETETDAVASIQSKNAPTEVDKSAAIGISNGSGETFLRTDQLDGETDWKLRIASPLTQILDPREFCQLKLVAAKPDKKVHEFFGTIEYTPRHKSPWKVQDGSNKQVTGAASGSQTAALSIDNTAWANTVLASNATVLAVVVYTGAQTRQAMSTSTSRSKTGLLDSEINKLSKILCGFTLSLSIILVALEGFESRGSQKWYVSIMRFLILFSTIIPISLRVNLDMGKSVYAWFIERDQEIPGTVVRTSTIPEELGRIEYLLSDKTGTLTQNDMELKKIHVGTVSYANEAMEEIVSHIRQGFAIEASTIDGVESSSLVTPSFTHLTNTAGTSTTRTRREIGSRVRDLVLALALCHNVTPSTNEENGQSSITYQASSPDEIAIVRWTESVGLRLLHRDRHSITLQSVDTSRIIVRVRILHVFPFTSEGKRMGIILRFFQSTASDANSENDAGETWFFQKGADTVMTSIVAANDWLDEETANMAREGLRTLVIGRKKLSSQQYLEFESRYSDTSLSLQDRDSAMGRVIKDHLEHNLELLGVTGVEDKLQVKVKPSLELLRNAGIKIWMLTGDKVETARCVAVSAKLVSRTQHIHTITSLSTRSGPSAATDALSLLRSKPDSTALLIDGASLSYYLSHHQDEFISLAVLLPAVIACRCSPTQKADVAMLIRKHTRKRVACIGDGGNDVSMIQAADIGIGIVGKEGRQASLAADFSVTQFHHVTKLLVWHGRNSYKRSAKLAQFVIHRGLIISVCQTVYSIATHFEPHALYRDWLLVGYATVYTMFPVFSLVLDRDVNEAVANLYPELYKELTSGTSLSYSTFFGWVGVSIYQGCVIQILSQILTRSVDSPRMVSISFSVLVINELVMVAFEIVTWHWIMTLALVATAAIYAASVPFLGGYFDLAYVWSVGFLWRVLAISAISLCPPYAVKILRRTLHPPSYRKVQGH